jgi:hypothetical protein
VYFRGEADRAFEWLERAYAQRDGGLTEMKGNPLLKNLERDPRYAAFLKKMRLPTCVPGRNVTLRGSPLLLVERR